MSRGRKAKDPKVIEMQGPGNHRPAPQPPPLSAKTGALDPPDWFGPDALEAWKFWTGQMADMGTLFSVDSLALQGACKAYERAVRHERRLNTDPENWRADIAATRAWKQVKDFAVEFGLTLVSRNRVGLQNVSRQLELDLETAIGQ